jgi:hypothetical protein
VSAHRRIDGELGGGRGRAGEAGDEWRCGWPCCRWEVGETIDRWDRGVGE